MTLIFLPLALVTESLDGLGTGIHHAREQLNARAATILLARATTRNVMDGFNREWAVSI